MKEFLKKIGAWLKKLWQRVQDSIIMELDPHIDPDTMEEVEELKKEGFTNIKPIISEEAKNLGFYPIMLTLTNDSDEEVELTCETKFTSTSRHSEDKICFTLGVNESLTRQSYISIDANLLLFEKLVVIDGRKYYTTKSCIPEQGANILVTINESGNISVSKKQCETTLIVNNI